jgi:RHH-type proline utilization regulon transcriptional repressor/proline dehydrogenase/delta 1-pyrroline-5-carboxylate dehydrogenase
VADHVIDMILGAATELRSGPAQALSTDVGPVIDQEAASGIHQHLERLGRTGKVLLPLPTGSGTLIPPQAFELTRVADLKHEVFGPVLHIVRWQGDPLALVDEINALGYGLTLGIQTRIDSRAQAMAKRARVGNVYVNRNMVGAVVGLQPFGGEGLSGTGPKAGGPHYLMRFCSEQTVTINTAAAGGNVDLLSQVGAH